MVEIPVYQSPVAECDAQQLAESQIKRIVALPVLDSTDETAVMLEDVDCIFVKALSFASGRGFPIGEIQGNPKRFCFIGAFYLHIELEGKSPYAEIGHVGKGEKTIAGRHTFKQSGRAFGSCDRP
ncbi:hypothetical protein SDC9_82822 [bioreactor metagenome]|uniref:Uncharacterized protein n=1 Tax=bioreactor metagenome TaxID=1076179 RepID=A0A644Z6I0_9ZZZZ